jgi:voltage-gated potassium channel
MDRDGHLDAAPVDRQVAVQRQRLLVHVQQALEKPMLLLAFVWLALFVWEAIGTLSPIGRRLGFVIWGAFVFEFLLGWVIAPRKWRYLRRNALSAIALVVPALRIGRIARLARLSRAARAVRGARLVRALTSINRGMKALGRSMKRRGFVYVTALTLLVTVAGAAGMYGLEPASQTPGGFETYGNALWWTAMIMTTMGSAYWPQTPAGRILCFFLSLYALGVLGYIAATLATFFVGRDAEDRPADPLTSTEAEQLRRDIASLRDHLVQSADATSRMQVISEGAPKRSGGPQ